MAVGASLLWRRHVGLGESWDALGSFVVLLPVTGVVLLLGGGLFVWYTRTFLKNGGIRGEGWKWRAIDPALVGSGTAASFGLFGMEAAEVSGGFKTGYR
jgi:hypothetical protein